MKTRTIQLGELCKTTSGGTPSRENPLYYGGDIPWVKSGELNDTIINKTEERITKRGLANSNAEIFPAGTLLVALYGATAGKLGVLGMDAATNQAICAIFPPDAIHRDFLRFYLLSRRSQLIEQRTGGAQPNISQDVIRKLVIPLPTLSEQQRIARQLEKANRLCRTRRYALELSDTFLQSVFLKMFGDPSTNSKGWDFESFEEFLEGIDAGVNFKPVAENDAASPWRVLKISAVTSGEFNARESKSISADVAPSNKLIVRKGDFLMSRANTAELVGAVCRVRNLPPKVLLPDKLWRVKFVEKSKLDPEYALILLQTREMRRRMGLVATGTSGSMKNITQEDAAALLLPIPPLPLQQEFAGIVFRFERLRVRQREAERQAEHLFQTLLHRAFAEHL